MAEYEEIRDRIQELADTFRVKAHLAGMDAKVAWEEELEPKVQKLEGQFEKTIKEMNVPEELNELERQLRELVDGLSED
jgi:hypothetical protein